MADPNNNNGKDRMIVTLTVGELEDSVEAAVSRALAKQQPEKLLFTVPEAAQLLNCSAYSLGERVREGKVPYHRPGWQIHFTKDDIKTITEAGSVPKKT